MRTFVNIFKPCMYYGTATFICCGPLKPLMYIKPQQEQQYGVKSLHEHTYKAMHTLTFESICHLGTATICSKYSLISLLICWLLSVLVWTCIGMKACFEVIPKTNLEQGMKYSAVVYSDLCAINWKPLCNCKDCLHYGIMIMADIVLVIINSRWSGIHIIVFFLWKYAFLPEGNALVAEAAIEKGFIPSLPWFEGTSNVTVVQQEAQ